MADIFKPGMPGGHTKGSIGDTYVDTITGIKYECTSAYNIKGRQKYEWEPTNARMTKGEVNAIVSEQLKDTIIDKDTITAAVEDHLTKNPVKAGVSEDEVRSIINTSVGTEVNAYLGENGLKDVRTDLDNSFSMTEKLVDVEFEANVGYINKRGELVVEEGTSFENTEINVLEGERYTIGGMGYYKVKLFVFLDALGNVLEYYPLDEPTVYESMTTEVVVPANAVMMKVSGSNMYPISIFKKVNVYKVNDAIEIEYGKKIDVYTIDNLISGYYLARDGKFTKTEKGVHTDYIDFTQHRNLYVTTTKQYSTRLVAIYDKYKNFIAILDDNNEDVSTITKIEDKRFNTADILNKYPNAKYMIVGCYPNKNIFRCYTKDKTEVETSMYTQKQEIIDAVNISNVLSGKKWVACGDSFTQGDFTGYVDSNGNEKKASDAYDSEWGMYKTYPWWIAKRNSMTLVNEALCGSDFTNINGASNPFSVTRYTKVATDADYITLMFGLNESSLTEEQIGTSADTDNTTLWGAYNIVFEYFLTNMPYAKIGVILPDAWMPTSYSDVVKEICNYWGIPYLDLKDNNIPMGIGGKNNNVSTKAKELRDSAFKVSSDNSHPNLKAHEYRSTFIENWLRSL